MQKTDIGCGQTHTHTQNADWSICLLIPIGTAFDHTSNRYQPGTHMYRFTRSHRHTCTETLTRTAECEDLRAGLVVPGKECEEG